MITFAWQTSSINAVPYPVLWFGDIPGEKLGGSSYLVKQKHVLTGDAEAEVWALPDSLSRINFCAQKYPYNDPDPVDTGPAVVIVSEVITTTVEEIEP